MKLLRFAEITYEPDIAATWSHWNITIDEVAVALQPYRRGGGHQDGDRVSLHVVQASIQIELPEINSEGLIVIPDGPRRTCESAIEHAANMVAVLNRTSRRISSTALAAAISADTPEEQVQLDAVRGMTHRNNLALAFSTPLKPSVALFESLNDRMDGVALMAEAFAHNTSSGRVREFVRLFESAFQRQFSTLGKKLTQTLHARFGYTREEIQEWSPNAIL